MKRIVGSLFVTLLLVLALGAAAAPGANPAASCNGVLVSSLAGQPGIVATLTREFHAAMKEAGLPPGAFDAEGAHVHAGGVAECLAALGD
jgi:hypothetical protein